MSLQEALSDILEADIPASFQRFGSLLDARWIDEALEKTGTASVRRRKLAAPLVAWLVIGMALFRDRSIQEVVSHLGLVLPNNKGKRSGSGCKNIAPSAVPQARYRLGDKPIENIFRRSAETWALAAADEHRWHGLALFGIDGSTFRIPDTEPNREAFGLPGSSRGQAGYPQTRLVTLMALRSHIIYGVAFGPYSGKKNGECSLALQLWPQLPKNSLVIVDKGFIDYGLFYRLSHEGEGLGSDGKHWLTRAKSNATWKTLVTYGEGDELVMVKLSSSARKKDPSLPTHMTIRAVRYQVKGFKPQTLLTSMLDPEKYPAVELAGLYHERWELELGYDEVKTHMLERQEALRSKKPEGVRQELWGIMLAYNLVRKEMLDVAEAAGVSPLRISFRHSLMLISVFCLVEAWSCAPGNLPTRLASHLETMTSLLVLPERRSKRAYKRHVKIKMSGYKRNPGRPAAKVNADQLRL
jgi:hypothetical protein